jgi:hypothetical protein
VPRPQHPIGIAGKNSAPNETNTPTQTNRSMESPAQTQSAMS